MKLWQRMLAALLAAALWSPLAAAALEDGQPMALESPCAILAETATGAVIFEKNADERREVASITKLMTILLVLEAVEEGGTTLDAPVTVSRAAAAMKGSQALLDAGSTYLLEELLRTTVMVSANDSAVALAEHLCGSEAAFVERMNRRAAEMGMRDTHYVNCTGYPQQGQYTTARDVLRLCCEVAKHPAYHTWAGEWIGTLTHPGGRITDLTNTNRLVRFYPGCDGFKTGSTDAARYCLAATAEKNGTRLVAIVLGTPTGQKRFDEARAMLDYGFAHYRRAVVCRRGDLLGQPLPVRGGQSPQVDVMLGGGLSMLLRQGDESRLRVETSLPEYVEAPVQRGMPLGSAAVLLDERVVARMPCVAAQDVPRPGFVEALFRILHGWR